MFRALATGARDYIRNTAPLYASINSFLWRQVSVMPIAIFAVVVISEFVSATVRRRIT